MAGSDPKAVVRATTDESREQSSGCIAWPGAFRRGDPMLSLDPVSLVHAPLSTGRLRALHDSAELPECLPDLTGRQRRFAIPGLDLNEKHAPTFEAADQVRLLTVNWVLAQRLAGFCGRWLLIFTSGCRAGAWAVGRRSRRWRRSTGWVPGGRHGVGRCLVRWWEAERAPTDLNLQIPRPPTRYAAPEKYSLSWSGCWSRQPHSSSPGVLFPLHASATSRS